MKTIKTLLFSLLLAGCAPPRPPLPPTTPTPSPSARPTPPTLEGQLHALENPGSLADFGISLRPSRDRLPLGERFTLELYSSREAYWHLYLFQSSGAVLTLLENQPARAGERRLYPTPPGGLRARPPLGASHLLLLATRRPLIGTVLGNYQPLATPRGPRPQCPGRPAAPGRGAEAPAAGGMARRLAPHRGGALGVALAGP